MKKSEQSLRDTNKQSNIHIMEILEGDEREREIEKQRERQRQKKKERKGRENT